MAPRERRHGVGPDLHVTGRGAGCVLVRLDPLVALEDTLGVGLVGDDGVPLPSIDLGDGLVDRVVYVGI
ncbi:hypothetical protein [Halobaculum limi]|uniref:hypothetical protein n=1 Tax=Halobaculum limi TaxID=3031916 RepID=UPI00240614DC|nr:hypothetical protein [Halobaculum sp. YSMS11]